MWDRRASLVRVKDGDTIVARLDQGFRDDKEIDVRLLGVYCPEKHEPGYAECRDFTEAWLKSEKTRSGAEWPFVVTTTRMKIADKEATSLERYLATITSLDGSRSLNAAVETFRIAKGYGPGNT